MKLSLIRILALFPVAFLGAQARNVSDCVHNCMGQISPTANGCNLTDIQCFCAIFLKLEQAALACMQQNCTAQDVQNADPVLQNAGSVLPTECAEFASSSVTKTTATTAFDTSGPLTPPSTITTTVSTLFTPSASTPFPASPPSTVPPSGPILVTRTVPASASPTSASQSSRPSRLGVGATAGVAIAAGAVTVCLGSLASCYIRRRKRRARSTHVDLFEGPGNGNSKGGAVSDAESRTVEDLPAYVAVARASPTDTRTQDRLQQVAGSPHCPSLREDVGNPPFTIPENGQPLQGRLGLVSPSGGSADRSEDGTVEALREVEVVAVAHDVDRDSRTWRGSESTLPPPYSSRFGLGGKT